MKFVYAKQLRRIVSVVTNCCDVAHRLIIKALKYNFTSLFLSLLHICSRQTLKDGKGSGQWFTNMFSFIIFFTEQSHVQQRTNMHLRVLLSACYFPVLQQYKLNVHFDIFIDCSVVWHVMSIDESYHKK